MTAMTPWQDALKVCLESLIINLIANFSIVWDFIQIEEGIKILIGGDMIA